VRIHDVVGILVQTVIPAVLRSIFIGGNLCTDPSCQNRLLENST